MSRPARFLAAIREKIRPPRAASPSAHETARPAARSWFGREMSRTLQGKMPRIAYTLPICSSAAMYAAVRMSHSKR